jgi:hypothetical protein
MSSEMFDAATLGFGGCISAPDAFTVGEVGQLARDTLAVLLVVPADLSDESADPLANLRAPCPELVVGYR